MKKLLITIVLLVLSFNQLNANCQSTYESNITNHWMYRGDAQSPVLVLGLGAIALAGVAVIPAIIAGGVTAGAVGVYYTAYKVNEKKQRVMIRLLNQAEYLLDAKRIPKVSDNFYKEIEVDAKNLKKRYEQIKENDKIKKHNREIRKANKKLTEELKLSVKEFDKFLVKLNKTGVKVSKIELANAIAYVNSKNMFCNSEMKVAISAKKKASKISKNKVVKQSEAVRFFQKNVTQTLAEIKEKDWTFKVIKVL